MSIELLEQTEKTLLHIMKQGTHADRLKAAELATTLIATKKGI